MPFPFLKISHQRTGASNSVTQNTPLLVISFHIISSQVYISGLDPSNSFKYQNLLYMPCGFSQGTYLYEHIFLLCVFIIILSIIISLQPIWKLQIKKKKKIGDSTLQPSTSIILITPSPCFLIGTVSSVRFAMESKLSLTHSQTLQMMMNPVHSTPITPPTHAPNAISTFIWNVLCFLP